ncbi:unnamed protein product [Amoebophrya sp. A120]|nr:unnamed protein product [Amoebophrya sp. A120]|eukprot:GSA120T00021798001.1
MAAAWTSLPSSSHEMAMQVQDDSDDEPVLKTKGTKAAKTKKNKKPAASSPKSRPSGGKDKDNKKATTSRPSSPKQKAAETVVVVEERIVEEEVVDQQPLEEKLLDEDVIEVDPQAYDDATGEDVDYAKYATFAASHFYGRTGESDDIPAVPADNDPLFNKDNKEWNENHNHYALTGQSLAQVVVKKAKLELPQEVVASTASRDLVWRIAQLPDDKRDSLIEKVFIRVRMPDETKANLERIKEGKDPNTKSDCLIARAVEFAYAQKPYEFRLSDGKTRKTTILITARRGGQMATFRLGAISTQGIAQSEWDNYLAFLKFELGDAAKGDEDDAANVEPWGFEEEEECKIVVAHLEEARQFVFTDEEILKLIDPSLTGNTATRLREAQDACKALATQIQNRPVEETTQLSEELIQMQEQVQILQKKCDEQRRAFENSKSGNRMFQIAEINNKNRARQDYLDLTVAAGRDAQDIDYVLDGEKEDEELNPFARKPMNTRNMWDMSVRNKEARKKIAKRENVANYEEMEIDPKTGKIIAKDGAPADSTGSPAAKKPTSNSPSPKMQSLFAPQGNGRGFPAESLSPNTSNVMKRKNEQAFFADVLQMLNKGLPANGDLGGQHDAKRRK